MLEVELKFPINSFDKWTKRLSEKFFSDKVVKQKDIYYVPKGILPKDRQFILRVRISENSELTYKKLSGNSWIEKSVKIDNPEVLKDILDSVGFKPFLTIKKTRQVFKREPFEVCVDSVEGLGDFVEIEYLHDDELKAKAEIKEFAKELGLPIEKAIELGYVPLLEKKLF